MSSTNPYLQGMKAAKDGATLKSNPYRKSTTSWQQWRAGYQAQKQREAKIQVKGAAQ